MPKKINNKTKNNQNKKKSEKDIKNKEIENQKVKSFKKDSKQENNKTNRNKEESKAKNSKQNEFLDKAKSLAKKIFKTKKNFYIFLGVLVAIFILKVIFLSALAIIKPEIQLGNFKPEDVTLQNSRLSMNDEYPEFNFDTPHRINFSNGTEETGENIQTKEENFAEGENTLELRPIKDLFFFVLVSNESTIKNIDVDRIPPEISVERESDDDYLLLEPIRFKVESNEELSGITVNSDVLGKENDEEYYEYTPPTGEQEIQIEGQDMFINYSEPVILNITSFSKTGWFKKDCNNISLAINGNDHQIGYDGFRDPASIPEEFKREAEGAFDICEDDNIYIAILPKGSKLVCWACDGNSNYIDFRYQNGFSDIDTFINDFTSYNYPNKKVITNEEYVGKYNDVSFRILEFRWYSEFFGENIIDYQYIFENNNKIYTLDTFYGEDADSSFKSRVKEDIKMMADSLKLN